MNSREETTGSVYGAVLAAGQGTRLRPLSDGVPKPLVAWLDGPMINIARRTLEAAGCEPIGFNTCYAVERLTDWARGEGIDASLLSHESHLLGTGGGVAKLARHLGAIQSEDAVIVSWNGDVVASPDIRQLIEDVQRGATASLLLRERMHDERGIEASLETRDIRSLPDHEGEHRAPRHAADSRWFGFTGIMAMRASALRSAPEGVELCSFRDILGPQLASGADIRFRYYDGFYSDLGTPERYFWACAAALRQDFLSYVSSGLYRETKHESGTAWIHRDATVAGDVTIIGEVVCGPGTNVAPGLTLENAVLIGADVADGVRSEIRIGDQQLSFDVDDAAKSYASSTD